VGTITCVLCTATVTDCCYVNWQINVTLLSTNIKLLQTSFDLVTDGLMPSVTDRLLIKYGILLQCLFLCYDSCVESIMEFLYGWCEHLFVTELNSKYFTRQIFKTVFEWLSLTQHFAIF